MNQYCESLNKLVMSGQAIACYGLQKYLLGLCLLLFSLSSQAAWLTGMEEKSVSGGSLLQLDFDEYVDYRSFTLDQPPRLVIDLMDARLGTGVSLAVKDRGLVCGLRHGYHPNNTLRLVFDLKEPVPASLSRSNGDKSLVVTMIDSETVNTEPEPIEPEPLTSLSSQGSWLMGMKQSPQADGSFFQFDFDEYVDYHTFTLDQPPRLVIDLLGARLLEGVSLAVKDQSLVRGLRHGQHPHNILRLVFDLKESGAASLSRTNGGKSLVVSVIEPEKANSGLEPIEPEPFEGPVASPDLESTTPLMANDRVFAGDDPASAPNTVGHAPVEPSGETPAPGVSSPISPIAEDVPGSHALKPAKSSLKHRWSGYFAIEGREYFQSPLDDRQHDSNFSLSFEPEYYLSWDSGYQGLIVKPFIRVDEHDDERTHSDLREFIWFKAGRGWEIQAGVGKVFWGVTEALHLVDIINQTDLVENIDGEQKLGQPMLKLSTEHGWGGLDLFILPYFRERTFPGVNGRLRTQPRVDVDMVRYESDDEERHTDFALRWFHTMGDWDIGLAHFHGTSRDPRLVPGLNGKSEVVLIPTYDQIDQSSLDLQATKGDWLWKLETLYRSGERIEDYWASTGGFEYTLWGVADTSADLGILIEYMWDERGRDASQPFQNDIFSGLRWMANDVDSTELLAGIIFDLDYDSSSLNIEASRRLGQDWKVIFEARAWFDTDLEEPFYSISKDDYAELSLYLYF